jgi:hypothetical protein
MSTFAADSLPKSDEPEEIFKTDSSVSSFEGSSGEIQWEVVARTAGLTPALIIAERLQTEGIPARAWQEGAGQAIGLTIGLLGTGYVVVPEEFVEEAESILNEPPDAYEI